MQKLEKMREMIDARLADPDLYNGPKSDVQKLHRKHAEVLDGLDRAEALWLKALEQLDAAGGAA